MDSVRRDFFMALLVIELLFVERDIVRVDNRTRIRMAEPTNAHRTDKKFAAKGGPLKKVHFLVILASPQTPFFFFTEKNYQNYQPALLC
jgi:hypothetical protein